ncbi:MAG: hypothetical protein EXR72_13185 [Myxococcales bacterium]|nr:hypothetical protein [Myxococcales bacterium]
MSASVRVLALAIAVLPLGCDAPGRRSDGAPLVDAAVEVDQTPPCLQTCSDDRRSVVDCHGTELEACAGTDACEPGQRACVNACAAAAAVKQSIGCEYYATFMPQPLQIACFAAFVANTWTQPAHVKVSYGGAALSVASFARIPSGSGKALTYKAFDPAAGIPPGEVVILFLAGPKGTVGSGVSPCPVDSAQPLLHPVSATTVGKSFRIQSDVPVVAYQMNPYGGGSAAVTGASLLLPTSVWDTNYVAVNAYENDPGLGIGLPTLNVVAAEDDTRVTMVPVAAVTGGGGIPAAKAGAKLVFTLQRGEHAQIAQSAALTGSVLQSDKRVGFMGGSACLRVPLGVAYCDHAEQMLPPVKALGSEYVGVMYRPRVSEPAIWRVVGTVNGTQLTWSSNVGGPASLKLGEVKEFITEKPFVVKSQDTDHPFMLFTYMSGSQWKPELNGHGDPEFVISVPPQQYMKSYVFFTDPTYPETNLVVVRAREPGSEQFSEVSLDCAGTLTGWKPIGDYEWTRVDLSTGDFQAVGKCQNGRHEMKSSGRFGLWVWGWGTPKTTIFTKNVSYGYPAGMDVKLINEVEIPPG